MLTHSSRCIRKMRILSTEVSGVKLDLSPASIGWGPVFIASVLHERLIFIRVPFVQACKEFVNKNGATGTSTTKSPELLAKHADALLRKNNKLSEEGDLEDALNQVVQSFLFGNMYGLLGLTRRTLHR